MSARRLLLAIALTAVVCAQTPAARADLLPVTVVRFRAHLVLVQNPATVGRAIKAAGAHPAYGQLLDIRGGVLKRNAFAPSFMRNGAPASRDEPVQEADAVDYADGKDAVEPSVVETIGSLLGNPGSHIDRISRDRRGLVSEIVLPLAAPDGPAVALTFDDGPDPKWTPAILDALDSAHASATFFVIGRKAAHLPDLVRREHDRGMSVEDHTWDHPRLTRHSPAIVSIANGLGLRTALWTLDPRDWSRPGSDVIVSRVLQQVRPGSIVVMHDGGRDRSQTVQAVRTLLRDLAARGYVFVSLR
jgi:peptidoglycan/xylan/chitin deacetylase (PgdA/CDA1 family)